MDITQDGFLGGKLLLNQPKVGYRAGIDPVLLAASCPAQPGDLILELGCGVGVASLCLAARIPGLKLHGVEILSEYAELARANALQNNCQFDVEIGSVSSQPTPFYNLQFHHVIMNPPYFVAGAIFSGFAMVQTLLIIMRKVSRLESYITIQHIEMMNIVIMITGSIVGCAYITELFIAWYSGVEYEQYAFLNRATGPYWWAYFLMMSCNVVSPQIMWVKKIRTNIIVSFII